MKENKDVLNLLQVEDPYKAILNEITPEYNNEDTTSTLDTPEEKELFTFPELSEEMSKRLSKAQIALYNIARQIFLNPDLTIEELKFPTKEQKKIDKTLKELSNNDEKERYKKELFSSLLDEAQELYESVELLSLQDQIQNPFGYMSMAKDFFTKNNTMFKYDVETDTFERDEKSDAAQQAYRDSLFLDILFPIVKNPRFKSGLSKRITKRYTKYTSKIDKIMTMYMKKNTKSTARTVVGLDSVISSILNISINKARIFIVALGELCLEQKEYTKEFCIMLFSINTSIRMLGSIRGDIETLGGKTAIILYNSLNNFFNIIKENKLHIK